MKLLPKSVYAYDEYRKSIIMFNKWFIQLRWFASASLLFYWIALKFIFGFELTYLQTFSMIGISVIIFSYNLYFIIQSRVEKSIINFNPLYFSLLQIVMDLIGLSIVIYYSGGLEAPVFMFYIFHMIIGSLLLPGFIMYFISIILIINLSLFAALEYFSIIPHNTITGLLPLTLYDKPEYVTGVLIIFSSVVIITVMLTSKIVNELYGRERHLKKALDELNASETSKQKYIMAIIHELKSPVVGSLSQLELVLGNYAGEINDEVRKRILAGKERLLQSIEITNNILHVSKFKLFKDIDKKEILIEAIISSVLKNIIPVAEKKNIKIKNTCNENKNIPILADSVLIELALSNLISNAVKYNLQDGHLIIKVDDVNGFRKIEITDDGIGIPSKEIEKVFDDYYRASNVKEREGTGIGLSVVKQIIDRHKGLIELKSPSTIGSKDRPGTDIIIRLPLK